MDPDEASSAAAADANEEVDDERRQEKFVLISVAGEAFFKHRVAIRKPIKLHGKLAKLYKAESE